MNEKDRADIRVLKSLIEALAKATHSFTLTLVVSMLSIIGAVANLFLSEIDSWKLALIAICAGGYFAASLLTERIWRKVLFSEVSLASVTMRVMFDQAKRKVDAAKEVALSLTYLSHLRKRHFRLKAILLTSSAALAVLGFGFPAFDLFALASMPVAFFALVLLKELVVEYRIRHGFFGTTQSEAREMIRFLIENSTDIDFTDGSGKLRRALLSEVTTQTDPLSRHSPGGVVA